MRLLALAAAFAATVTTAQAGPAADLLKQHLYAGTLAEGIEALSVQTLVADPEAQFGLGLLTLAQGFEGLGQGFYRHGLDIGAGREFGLFFPVPVNPAPAPLDYGSFRGIVEGFVVAMDRAEVAFQAARDGDYVVPVDLMQLRLDLNGDGTADDSEMVGGLLLSMISGDNPVTGGEALPSVEIGFDAADAIWFSGYTQVFAAQGDFLLAHDFQQLFEVAFHRLFPRAGLPMQDFLRGGRVALDPESDAAIADAIAAIHTLNWPVSDQARFQRVRQRLLSVIALSRQNWDAILLETDDNRELLPSPKQTSIVPDITITDETVAAWRATLDTAEQILNGELLVPHWRFRQGFDLKAWFDTSTHNDLVLLFTGPDALPYLKEGPVADVQSFAAANAVFGNDWLGYAFWFN
jgi:hypothetical protein